MTSSTTSTHSKAESPRLLIQGIIKIVLKFGLVFFLVAILLGGNPLLNEIKNISG